MKPRHSVYCVRPMTGCSFNDVRTYYKTLTKKLHGMGYRVYHPLVCKEELFSNRILDATCSNDDPYVTNRAIFSRDKWMVRSSDIIYANLFGAKQTSIGSCFELAWGHILGKHIIVVMEQSNPHRHTFVLEASDLVFTDERDALQYMKTWGTS